MKRYTLEMAQRQEDRAAVTTDKLQKTMTTLLAMTKAHCPFVRAHAKAALRKLRADADNMIEAIDFEMG